MVENRQETPRVLRNRRPECDEWSSHRIEPSLESAVVVRVQCSPSLAPEAHMFESKPRPENSRSHVMSCVSTWLSVLAFGGNPPQSENAKEEVKL